MGGGGEGEEAAEEEESTPRTIFLAEAKATVLVKVEAAEEEGAFPRLLLGHHFP